MSAAYDEWEPPPDPEEQHRRTWQAVDLTHVLDGSWEPAVPTVGSRSDGVGMFYPGKVHTVSSESEAGKTWFALSAVVDEIVAGNDVLYLDFEDDEGGVTNRLLAMQTRRDAIAAKFHYVRPMDPLGTGINLDDLNALLVGLNPTLVVIDGVTEAMTMHGLNPLDNKDVAMFGRILPRRMAESGPAVVCLDHVTKSAEGRGRYAIGGVHKLNGLDGAAYVLDNRKPFGVGLTGVTTVRIAKDRPAQLRKHGLPGKEGLFWFADLRITSHAENFLEVEVLKPEENSGNEFRPTGLMAKVAGALTEHGPMSQRTIVATVRGNRQYAIDALHLLIRDGYVSKTTPHELVKPFLERVDSA